MQGKSALVTGGSRGIGKAIALRFARDGAARVAIGYYRNDDAAAQTAEELRALGAEPVLVRGNISGDRVLREIAELGPLDVVVHNAATGVIRPALEVEDKHWDWTLNANARALLSLARATVPSMPRGSSIVAISSLGAQRVMENYSLVGTSKAGAPVYVDYAHKPEALETVLATLRPFARGKLVVVFGCGGDRDRGKRPVMGEIATRLADFTLITDDNPRSEDPMAIRAEIMRGIPAGRKNWVEVRSDRRAAIEQGMAALGSADDLLLIAGKGHEAGQTIKGVTHPFDDAEVARELAR